MINGILQFLIWWPGCYIILNLILTIIIQIPFSIINKILYKGKSLLLTYVYPIPIALACSHIITIIFIRHYFKDLIIWPFILYTIIFIWSNLKVASDAFIYSDVFLYRTKNIQGTSEIKLAIERKRTNGERNVILLTLGTLIYLYFEGTAQFF